MNEENIIQAIFLGTADKEELLESLGFVIDYKNHNVKLGKHRFGFTKVKAETSEIILAVIEQSLRLGRIQGKNEKMREIRSVLELH